MGMQHLFSTANTTVFDYPLDTSVDITETVTFSCSASGIPLPDITWYKDGTPLDTLVENITVTTNSTTSVTSVLVLSQLVLMDAGQYSCNASDPESGTDIRHFTLTLQSKETINIAMSGLYSVLIRCCLSPPLSS